MLPYLNATPRAALVGRVWRPGRGPCLVAVRGNEVFDITSRSLATMRDLLEHDDPASQARAAPGEEIATLAEIAMSSSAAAGENDLHLLSPADLQAIKAAGVTFAASLVERVIEERAGGDTERAASIRARIGDTIGASLSGIKAGSREAGQVRAALRAEGHWSQILEVGIGPQAGIFTKCQPMASVGWGASMGLQPEARRPSSEPGIVLAVDSRGQIRGATLGNDLTLRDVESRSSLLLGEARDGHATCAIGPFIRLFDEGFTLDHIRHSRLGLQVSGEDGFSLDERSSMEGISRDPGEIVAQIMGPHHQYPDGVFVFLGTMFAPTEDRNAPGQGFAHRAGDQVAVSEETLGELSNNLRPAQECPPWRLGTSALMRNLAGRGLL